MIVCHLCGETKSPGEFLHWTNFTKYKKQPVQWCRDCQKMFMERKHKRDIKKKLPLLENKFEVSFE